MDERTEKFELDRCCLLRLQKLGVEIRHFLDAGASDGGWTRHICGDFQAASFDLFEPLVGQVPELRQEIEKALIGPRFRLHSLALGAKSNLATMYLYPENLRGSTALELSATPQGARVIQVPMLTIDEAITELGLPIPDVVKMDTQGCELNILKGARKTLPKVKALFLECWLVRGYGRTTPLLLELADFLREFDFHFWDFTGQWRDADGSLGAQDCVFLNARSKESRLQQEPKRSSESPHSNSRTLARRGTISRWFRARSSV